MLRLRRYALLTLPLATACIDGGETTAAVTDSPTTVPGTSNPDVTGPGTTTDSPTSTSNGTGTDSGTESTAGPTTDAPPTGTDPTLATTGTVTTENVSVSTTAATDTTGEPPICPEDQIVCDGNTAQVCDGMGGFKSEEACPTACAPDLGCVECVPGESECQGDNVATCNDTGTGFEITDTCDALQGLACDADVGACLGACAGLGLSYIGCDYYPTVTKQYDLYNTAPTDVFAVAVANTSAQMVNITVTRGANMVAASSVAPNAVQILELPWVNELTKGDGPSALVVDGAYRLRTTGPVTVYQYNPLKATTTNDASLLLPVNTWTGNYVVAARGQWTGIPGFYAVTARQDNTTVTLTPSATGKIIAAGGGVAADGTGVVVLNESDVLQVVATASDPTGTIVTADKPVQVIGGHKCTNVPDNVAACDHLEESMFPIETLAKEYVVVPPVQVPNDQLDKAQMVRIIASEANTTLTFNPDQPVAKTLTNAGDFIEIASTTAKFVVSADKKILVAQYMVGQNGGFGTSDPSMLLAVNPLQWRKDYLVHAPTNWVANYVDLIAKTGTSVTVDNVAVASWAPIGNTGYVVGHVKLSNAGDGNHRITADQGVSVAIGGVMDAGSYWYPGGLDLDLIPQ
ncbi:IgGFc-binding protein [Nannocystis punicea]|uniref:IgGFc-binding protein n=1 Tax=Nannocystis punicea TaxID=2995304 RepID=A0ABY7H210_9BACT|nr:IgGFc-binding protein [Nannocystis poenicansa]WAS93213.1 IgGFc-binding protein [Nannocystis poenicansa]